MDIGLGVQWLLSPFTTALAAGALVAFCVAALWKQHFRPSNRRDSAPESTTTTNHDSSGASNKAKLFKSNSDSCLGKNNLMPTSGVSTICNLPSYSNESSITFHPKFVSSGVHPFGLDANLLNSVRFDKIYSLPYSRSFLSNQFSEIGSCTLANCFSLVPRVNLPLSGNIYPRFLPKQTFQGILNLSERNCKFKSIPLQLPDLSLIEKYKYRGDSLTVAAKDLLLKGEFYPNDNFLVSSSVQKRKNTPFLFRTRDKKISDFNLSDLQAHSEDWVFDNTPPVLSAFENESKLVLLEREENLVENESKLVLLEREENLFENETKSLLFEREDTSVENESKPVLSETEANSVENEVNVEKRGSNTFQKVLNYAENRSNLVEKELNSVLNLSLNNVLPDSNSPELEVSSVLDTNYFNYSTLYDDNLKISDCGETHDRFLDRISSSISKENKLNNELILSSDETCECNEFFPENQKSNLLKAYISTSKEIRSDLEKLNLRRAYQIQNELYKELDTCLHSNLTGASINNNSSDSHFKNGLGIEKNEYEKDNNFSCSVKTSEIIKEREVPSVMHYKNDEKMKSEMGKSQHVKENSVSCSFMSSEIVKNCDMPSIRHFKNRLELGKNNNDRENTVSSSRTLQEYDGHLKNLLEVGKNKCEKESNVSCSLKTLEIFQECDVPSVRDSNDTNLSPRTRVEEREWSKVDPSALGNCHTREAAAATLPIEVEKSINSDGTFTQSCSNLERFQERGGGVESVMTPQKRDLSFAENEEQTIWKKEERPIGETLTGKNEGRVRPVTNDRDVTRAGGERGAAAAAEESSRVADDREARSVMDRGAAERSGEGAAACYPVRLFESSVTSEMSVNGTGETRLSTAVVSSVTLEDFYSTDLYGDKKANDISPVIDITYRNGKTKTDDFVWPPPKTDCVHSTPRDVYRNGKHSADDFLSAERNGKVEAREYFPEAPFRPTFEEYMPTQGDVNLEETIKELNDIAGRPLVLEESPPRVSRLLGLLSRDEERRARATLRPADTSIDGEWDRILHDVLASVSELERWEDARRGDVRGAREDGDAAEDDDRLRHQSHSSLPSAMEEEALSPPQKGETPTKVKNLRFKLDPDIFDVPSDDSFYDEDDNRRPGWRRQQPKYRTFSSLELGDEPVQLVSVHASVVPAGQKMVARPVGIDLRVRLTEERQSKRAHVGTSPSQSKRRSPVSDARVGWCQELSPVTENVDWRETFSSVPKENNVEPKPVPNGILKTPSPKIEAVEKDTENPFKKVNGEVTTNGEKVPVVPTRRDRPPISNGVTWNSHPKKLSLPRKKFEPDPEAVERITGYKTALTKPPLPPPVFHKIFPLPSKINRAELARKQYLDSKAALSCSKTDGSRKFQQFVAQAQNDRAKIITSVPDLAAIEKAVSEKWAKDKANVSPRVSPGKEEALKHVDASSSRGSTPDDAWTSYVQSCRKHLGRRSQSLSYLETDVDVLLTEFDDKWRSTSALDEPEDDEHSLPIEDSDFEQSQEDLNDSGHVKSEHELRVQKSLQSLPLPDWYKKSDKTRTGFILRPREKEKSGWAAAKSLASSTSSLASVGLRRPIHSLRSSRENIPWSRTSPSPDGPSLSLALAKAFREPYLGWRARTSTSSGVSSSPRTSPPSWCAATTDDEANGVSFDGEDAFGHTSSDEGRPPEGPPSLDDTGADVTTVSMDTGDVVKMSGAEDTCEDINNMSMDTCEIVDQGVVPDVEVDLPVVEVDVSSPQGDTGNSIDNLTTDTTENKKKDPKLKRYSYSQSIYYSEWADSQESRGDRKSSKKDQSSSPSPDNKVIWIESSFVGSRTTTSIMVLPDDKEKQKGVERPASR